MQNTSSIGPNRPVWSWLNFWMLRSTLAPIMARDAVVLPYQVRIRLTPRHACGSDPSLLLTLFLPTRRHA